MLSKGNEDEMLMSELMDTGAVPSDYQRDANMMSMSQGVVSRGSRKTAFLTTDHNRKKQPTMGVKGGKRRKTRSPDEEDE